MIDAPTQTWHPKDKESSPVFEINARERLSYPGMAERMQKRGEYVPSDPRAHLDPVRVRRFSQKKPEELLRHYGQTLEAGLKSATSRDARIRYAAALRIHRQATGSGASRSDVAKSREKAALHLAIADPSDRAARQALELSVGINERQQRDRALVGYEGRNPTISAAAKAQGRSWIDVRDDLARFGVLPTKDPRRRIQAKDVEQVKSAKTKGPVISPEKAEKVAVKKLAVDPRNKNALGLLLLAGARSTPEKTRDTSKIQSGKRPGFGRMDLDHQI